MMQYEDPPTFIMLHVGANDIGNVKLDLIQFQLKSLISWIAKQMPYAKIIFLSVSSMEMNILTHYK
jgi:lysophospholipase L1-like esterase